MLLKWFYKCFHFVIKHFYYYYFSFLKISIVQFFLPFKYVDHTWMINLLNFLEDFFSITYQIWFVSTKKKSLRNLKIISPYKLDVELFTYSTLNIESHKKSNSDLITIDVQFPYDACTSNSAGLGHQTCQGMGQLGVLTKGLSSNYIIPSTSKGLGKVIITVQVFPCFRKISHWVQRGFVVILVRGMGVFEVIITIVTKIF